ncbi:MAG: hypothetical protein COB38_10005 [Gammaproteobacteria bacterium]|nr:MAG: hypothetical protein COB38_10005 [Gammaproteobacteria bacterium]
MKITLYYATNRNHLGKNRWKPEGYGQNFSSDRNSNLRFGKVELNVDNNTIENDFLKKAKHKRIGDGIGLSAYLTKQAKQNAKIKAYKDITSGGKGDVSVDKLASTELFQDLKKIMDEKQDIMINIHGFNVDWWEAVGSAMALELMLNRENIHQTNRNKSVTVFLFSWPSNGEMMKDRAYSSDRQDATDSGIAVARGFLKLRDFLMTLRPKQIVSKLNLDPALKECGQELHLLCHSMGNFVFENALASLKENTNQKSLPRLFKNIFMCAPDVADNVLEKEEPMQSAHELCRNLNIYYNRGDVAMYISDYTKGNSERLGHAGAARPEHLHNKIYQVDCSNIVGGMTEHSYYLWGSVNEDIVERIHGVCFEDENRMGELKSRNVFELS